LRGLVQSVMGERNMQTDRELANRLHIAAATSGDPRRVRRANFPRFARGDSAETELWRKKMGKMTELTLVWPEEFAKGD